MTEWPLLKNAPISEALIDIRVQLPPEVGIADLESIHDRIRDEYPDRHERFSGSATLGVKPQQEIQVSVQSTGVDGYVHENSDRTLLFQARLDGFTINRLQPYESWTKLRDEAQRMWSLYEEVARPLSIKRLALRYINRIELPSPVGDIKDWLLTAPELGQTLPQTLEGVFMRLVVPFEAEGAKAIITQALEPSPTDTFRLILDIDAFKIVTGNVPDIWRELQELRDIKNQVFYGSITEKLKGLFE